MWTKISTVIKRNLITTASSTHWTEQINLQVIRDRIASDAPPIMLNSVERDCGTVVTLPVFVVCGKVLSTPEFHIFIR